MSEQQLFPFAARSPVDEQLFGPDHRSWSSRLGALTEAKAIAELLRRGFKVARPVVDDDGVDLIVNYRTTVQVKGAASPREDKRRRSYSFRLGRSPAAPAGAPYLAAHIDVVMCHALDIDCWWIIPAQSLRPGLKGLHIPTSGGGGLAQWRDAWGVLGDS